MIQPTASLALIDVPEARARDFDPVWAEALAAMINVQGLLQPVLLRPGADGRYILVAGLHRLEAFRSLGRLSIPMRVSAAESDAAARLEEVMENLGRQDLIALDRCHHLHALKAVWLQMYPQAKAGGERPGAGRPASKSDSYVSEKIKRRNLPFEFDSADNVRPFGFSDAVVDRIGLSARWIREGVRIWHYLSPDSRRRLAGTDMARKQTELKALSEEKPAVQAKVLDLILEERRAGNVAEALELLKHGVLPNAQEARFRAFSQSFGKLRDEEIDSLLAVHDDKVIASLQRRGRI